MDNLTEINVNETAVRPQRLRDESNATVSPLVSSTILPNEKNKNNHVLTSDDVRTDGATENVNLVNINDESNRNLTEDVEVTVSASEDGKKSPAEDCSSENDYASLKSRNSPLILSNNIETNFTENNAVTFAYKQVGLSPQRHNFVITNENVEGTTRNNALGGFSASQNQVRDEIRIALHDDNVYAKNEGNSDWELP